VSVFGPREARVRAQTLHDRAAIHVEVNIAPFSTGDRRRRGRGDKCVYLNPGFPSPTLLFDPGACWSLRR
jgi:hypothetical protein